jgi:uncharacterized protein (DUF3084 family)
MTIVHAVNAGARHLPPEVRLKCSEHPKSPFSAKPKVSIKPDQFQSVREQCTDGRRYTRQGIGASRSLATLSISDRVMVRA